MKYKFLLIFLLSLVFNRQAYAGHLMGGEITWLSTGGSNYEFTLVIYRDCSGLDIIDPSIDIRVWGHPMVTDITCDFVESIDLSPDCSVVFGSPSEIDCGVGSGGGSGPGAIQKYVYRSSPINLTGTPPASGWAFTYDSFSRNWDLDNIADPFAYGFTLSSIMYALPDESCKDSSPQFAQNPYMLLCSGSDFKFDANAFDKDNDSLVFSWGVPLDEFPGGTFNPPVNPAPVPFNPGYSNINPTPDASFDAGNIPASMDPISGEITFTSNTIGNYGFVQRIDSYRDGVLIATVNRESQLVIIPCVGYANTPPTIIPPFAGGTSFDSEYFAGDLINFDIEINDIEFLQDGTPQTVTLIPSGNYFGDGFTNPMSGCDETPCATLDTAPVIEGVQGVTTNFNWQTSCDHLLDACGVQQQEQIYTFVLNAKDDYCSVPGITYETIRIKIKNKSPVTAVNMNCVDVLDNGDVVLSWTPSVDPSGTSFVEYQVFSVSDGLIATIPTIATNTYSIVGAGADLVSKDYYIVTRFGCDGGVKINSDTLSSIFMEMDDLADGRVRLKWNETHLPKNDGDAIKQQIYREYPIGVWTLRGEVNYGTNLFIDTIDVCEDFLSYEIRVNNDAGCISTSNKKGLLLKDIINPLIPVMDWVTVNPVSNLVDISWNVNPSEDTYGYIIYVLDGVFWEPIDTVWGRTNTTYSNVLTTADIAPESYRVSAFDSCLTDMADPTYQTSALSDAHTTIHLKDSYDLCAKTVSLSWTPYIGFEEEILKYEVFGSQDGGAFELLGTITSALFEFDHSNLAYGKNFCYYVKVTSVDDSVSLSNKVCRYSQPPSKPAFHYLAKASHTLGNDIELLCYSDETAAVNNYEIEVKVPYSSGFETIASIPPTGMPFFSFTDENVFPERGAYQYRINLIDTCGQIGAVTNIVTTSFLNINTDHTRMTHTLDWSSYQGFDGGVVQYDIYRGENGVFDGAPIATTLPGVRSYVDDVSSYFDSQGQLCYRVEAVEGPNSFGFEEYAYSNAVCATIDPLVYIPNAFMVNGVNHIFLPIVSLYDFNSYSLSIYDRWGHVLFNTIDRAEGWSGINNATGELAEEGLYVYLLNFKDREGNDYVYRGTVTLLIAE